MNSKLLNFNHAPKPQNSYYEAHKADEKVYRVSKDTVKWQPSEYVADLYKSYFKKW
ncbi:hypothetical protein [Salinicoccus albus]|uniref:hypothetical protein n=1 Tax=Salinicoccus albus TaxID=418756 RepID=UPI00036E3B1A|nr:hypothetical protein [Salinicoccus albus]